MVHIVQPRITVGDRPGYGTWRCLSCNWRVKLEDHKTPLPPCGGECKKSPAADDTTVCYTQVRGLT